jgi:cytochrome c oxidase subunit 1
VKLVGFVLAVIPILMNEASVMYTFYPPMAAHPVFYIGLALIVVGVWLCCIGAFIQVANWRKKSQRTTCSYTILLCNWCIHPIIFRSNVRSS